MVCHRGPRSIDWQFFSIDRVYPVKCSGDLFRFIALYVANEVPFDIELVEFIYFFGGLLDVVLAKAFLSERVEGFDIGGRLRLRNSKKPDRLFLTTGVCFCHPNGMFDGGQVVFELKFAIHHLPAMCLSADPCSEEYLAWQRRTD